MSLTKAKVVSAERSKVDVDLDVQFNPKELTVKKSVSWKNAQGPSKEDPMQEVTEPMSRTLSATLYFDTWEETSANKSVQTKYIDKLEKLVTLNEELGRPPLVIFQWGKFHFKGVITSLTQKYTMFFADGTPCRCEVGLEMKSANDAQHQTVPPGPSPPGEDN